MAFTEHEIAAALQRDEFLPYFQPLVELRSGHIEGFEVLARWKHPALGMVPPDEFISVMEKSGLINSLTMCLLRQTFRVAAGVPAAIGFSVNVSPTQLHDRMLPGMLAEMSRNADFDLRRLTVELTESALVHDLQLAGEVAGALKSLGIKLALDDFGTGYSSLLHLQALPFDEIKVDGSFVRTMIQSRQSRKITSAVVSLGQSLGMRTIAEGVEETSQAEMLLWHGCNLGQGWLYERPMPAEKLAEVLARQLPVIDLSTAASGVCEAAVTIDTRPGDRVSQLRAIYDGAPVGLGFVDRDLRYVSLNQRLADMHGLPIEAHIGRRMGEVAPELLAQKEVYLQRALEGEVITEVELNGPVVRPGEPASTLLMSFQPASDEAGEIIGVSVSMVDISATKRHERALMASEQDYLSTLRKLQESEARMRAIFRAAPVGIVMTDAPSGRVTSVNPCAEAIFGSALRPGVLWSDIVRHGFDEHGAPVRPEDMPMLRALHHGETVQGVEIYFRHGIGPARWLSVSGAPVYGDHGKLKGALVAVQEIDKPKQKPIQMHAPRELPSVA